MKKSGQSGVSKVGRTVKFALGVLCLGAVRGLSGDCVPPPGGLVSWWGGNGNSADIVGGNNASLVGDVLYRGGIVAQGFVFDGSGDAVQLGNPNNLQLQDFTVEGWVQRGSTSLTSQVNADFGYIFGCAWGGYGVGLWSDGRLSLTKVGYSNISSTNKIADTNFHHFAVTKSGGTVSFYIDGVGETVGPYDPGFVFNGPSAIGARGMDFDASFLGEIDELSIYNHALSASDVQVIYNAANAGKCAPSPTNNCVPSPSGLVSWWPAQGSTADIISGNNGTLLNGATFAPGKVGQAFSFSGNNQEVQVANTSALNPTNALSLETWVYFQTLPFVNAATVVGKDDGGSARQLQLGVGDLGSGFIFRSLLGVVGQVVVLNGTTVLKAGTWYHVAMTYDGSFLKLYVNGLLDASMSLSGAVVPTSQPLQIGGLTGGPWFINGLVDELSLYNRALSVEEIQAISHADSSGKCFAPTAPVIVGQPANQTVTVGSDVSFTVTADGTEPLSFQWVFNGTNPVAGANGPSLQLSDVQMSQGGTYAVLVTNAYGFAVSSNALLTINPPPACIGPAPGLTSWWPGNGNALDIISSNNGVLLNGATFAPGKVGQAFSFNGNNQEVQVANTSSLNPRNALTLETWVYLRTIPSVNAVTVVGKDDGGGGRQFQLGIGDLGNGFTFRSLLGVVGQVVVLNGTTVVKASTWYHVAMTYDGSSLKLYVNGVLDASMNLSGPIVATTQPLQIGGLNGGPWFINGLVDEPSLYDQALSAIEIQAIFSANTGGKCSGPTPPTILVQPNDATVVAGESAEFDVTASGSIPLTYQWLFNFTNVLAGANGPTLLLSNLQRSQTGTYTVLVTNEYGSVVSSNAILTVNPPPPCSMPVSGLVSWWRGENNTLDQVSGNHGFLVGNANYSTGEVGVGLAFDGSGDAMKIENPANLQLQDFTIESWIRRASTSVTSQDTPNFGYIFGCAWGGYGLGLWNDGRLCLTKVGYSNISSTNTITDLKFHHVAVTKSGSTVTFYIDGMGEIASPYDPGFVFNGPLAIGARGMDFASGFYGAIDELSIYSRSLVNSEIQSIYSASVSGKCVVPVIPSFIIHPVDQTVTVGSNVTFTVGLAGTPPFSYQWLFNGTDIVGETNASLVLTNVRFAQAGSYSVVVTNAAGSATSSKALLRVDFPPAILQIASVSNTPSGLSVTIPVILVANGSENGLGFSLNFQPAQLSFAGVGLGAGGAGASLFANTNQIDFGKLGLVIAFPAGQTSAAGSQEVVDVTFTASFVTNGSVATISFGDQPVGRELSDALGNPLAASYINGTVGIAPAALEGDVWPSPVGDEGLNISDWVLVGRYAAGLDSPTNPLEFQRADCAPRSSLGDGQITVVDWVQAGRYAAGLDPLTVAGGPTNQTSNPGPLALQTSGPHKLGGGTRQLLVTSGVLFSGQTSLANVQLVAQGDENALGFSVDFDPTVLNLAGLSAGANAAGATFDINTNQAGSGRVGVVLALPLGTSFAAGTQQLVKLSFQSVSTNMASSAVTFGDVPVLRQVSDSTATALAANYAGTWVSVNPAPSLNISQAGQNVSLSWPGWASNYVLQSSVDIGFSSVWSNAPVAVMVTNGTGVVTVPVSGQAQFYRLIRR